MTSKKIQGPAFILDEEKLIKNLEILKSIIDKTNVEILLAQKGFACWHVYPLIKKYLSGATSSSLWEAKLCYEKMGLKTHSYSPAFSNHEIDEFLEYSSHMVFNSLSQYEEFGQRTREKVISCGLRVNPLYSPVQIQLYNPSSPESRLGVGESELKEGLPEGIEGLHMHTLCESGPHHLKTALERFERHFGHHFDRLKWVNFGGGHLITDKDYDQEFLIQILNDFQKRTGLKIFLEPGAAVVWEAGTLIANVLDIVDRNGEKTAMTDISFAAHMPDTLEMPYKPDVEGTKEPDINSEFLYRIGGNTCLAGDYLDSYDFGKPLNVGDQLTFESQLHYTLVKTTMFNGVKHPDFYLRKINGEYQHLRSFSYEDFASRMG